MHLLWEDPLCLGSRRLFNTIAALQHSMYSTLVNTETDNQQEFDQSLDAKGLNCPLPILKTKVLLNKMNAGEILFVEATDPHSQVDFEAYCARTEHEIIKSDISNDVYRFYIRRAKNPKNI